MYIETNKIGDILGEHNIIIIILPSNNNDTRKIKSQIDS